jgi:3-oxoadipate enol-lactonase
MTRLHRTDFQVPSGPVSVLMTDSSRCDVLLLHSMGLDAASFELAVEDLPGSVSAWAVDLWGHGQTRMRVPFSLEGVADDVAAVAAAAGSPLVLVGVSYGGAVAQLVAARRPETVSHLVLANTFASWPGSAQRLVSHRGGRQEAGSDDAWYQKRLSGAMVGDAPARARDLYLAAAQRNTSEDFFATAEVLYPTDLTPVWERITCPVTVVTGELESRIPHSVTEHLTALAGLAEPVVIPGASHLTYLDRPKEFAEIIAAVAARDTAD